MTQGHSFQRNRKLSGGHRLYSLGTGEYSVPSHGKVLYFT
jgi:hypothetical protein